LADYVGSTAALLKHSINSDATKFIVATESGIIHQMQKESPDKEFIPAPPNDSTCACNDCEYMKLNSLEKLYNSLKYEWPSIDVEEDIRVKAVKPINRMLDISKKAGL
jgi:quinolinate synthase